MTKLLTPKACAIGATTVAMALLATDGLRAQTPPARPSPPAVVAPAPAVPGPQTPGVSEAQRLSEGFAQVAEAVLPAVVSVRVEARAGVADAPFDFPFPFGGGGRRPPGLVRGTGSGVVIRQDGVILTNHHVVEEAQRITVHLRDGRRLVARVLGTDRATDLAVIKVDAQGLVVSRFGDSDAARVGEWVLAIGAPFGLDATVTHGVLSAKGRAGIGANQIEDYLQTDASINPGNSGGPLVNLRGEVLGINTMIIGRGTNIGFAVPSRIARQVTEQILERGHVTRGWVGLGVQDLTSELAESFGLSPHAGVVVSQVTPGGPGARAGLQVGDVITAIDGRAVAHAHEVVRYVTARAPGARMELDLVRGGQTRRLTVTAGRRPEEGVEESRAEGRGGRAAHAGLQLESLPPGRAAQLGLSGGVLVTGVEPGSPAERAGLEPGDVIIRADRAEVRAPGEVLGTLDDGRSVLLVRRGPSQLFVPLDLR